MSKLVTSPVRRVGALRNSVLGMAVATALALPQVAAAYEFDLGSEDLSFRWDNTLRINIQDRVGGVDKKMTANPNYDDGDLNFKTGSIFTRFDVYSEMDLVWKPSWGMLGARVSAAGWWDPGYDSLDNTSIQTANNLSGGEPTLKLPGYTKRYAKGPSGEFMDWFVFSSFTVGEVPVNVKAGQTTVYYGEALYAFAHAISYSQNPIDVWKALATPGAEVKELYRPRVGFNINSQVTDTLNVAAQYFFNWQDFSNQAYRYPETGSYLTLNDALLYGAKSLVYAANPLYGYPSGGGPLGPLCNYAPIPGSPTCAPQQWLRFWRGKDIEPEENTGNYGFAVRWDPEWADATLGAYYRRTYDMQPQVMVTPALIPGFPNPGCALVLNGAYVGGNCLADSVVAYVPNGTPGYPNYTPAALNQTGQDFINDGRVGTYNVAYGSGIDIIGLSLSKNIGGLALGAELSYRSDMPLISEPVQVLPAALRGVGVPLRPGAIWSDRLPKHDTPGAKGDTMHGLVNLVGLMGESPMFDSASWAAELSWMTYLNVTQNEAVFKGRSAKPGYWSAYNLLDQADKNYFGLAINFTPTWYQVLPGMDMLAPLSWSQGISGNSAVSAGGQEGGGTFGIGVAADFYQKYRFDLKYVGFYGDIQSCNSAASSTPAVAACSGLAGSDMALPNGTFATVRDRAFISLTFKTTF
ncbi:MAG: DUF1302 domain-containing protein [Steroidobacteraceae bacterium]|nr:DUF1302 domain-containing protein [Steroidobacteraceae bacterium]